MEPKQPPIPGISEALQLDDITMKRTIGQEALFLDLIADISIQEEV